MVPISPNDGGRKNLRLLEGNRHEENEPSFKETGCNSKQSYRYDHLAGSYVIRHHLTTLHGFAAARLKLPPAVSVNGSSM